MSEPQDPLPPLESLPSALGALFEREAKSEIVVDSARRAAAFARVSRALDFALPPAPPRAPATSLTAKIVAIAALSFVAGGIVGGALVYGTTRKPAPEAPVMTAPVAIAPSPPVASSAPVALPPPTVAISDLPSSTSASTPAPRPSADQGATGGLARERETLDAARAALVHGDQAEVLRKVHEHEVRWPHGALEEEREVLAIQALAASGQRAAAEARAARFRQRYPQSMLNDAVTAALSGPR